MHTPWEDLFRLQRGVGLWAALRQDFVTGKALLMKPEKLEVARNFVAFGCCDAISRLFHACSKFKNLFYMCMVRELFRKCIQLCIGYKE